MHSQSSHPSGSTLKTAARNGTLTISTCTTATVPAMARNVAVAEQAAEAAHLRRQRPAVDLVPHLEEHVDREENAHLTDVQSGESQSLWTRSAAARTSRQCSMPTAAPASPPRRTPPCRRSCRASPASGCSRRVALRRQTHHPVRGGSEHRAIDANVSMMTLIHSSCSTVNGGLDAEERIPETRWSGR